MKTGYAIIDVSAAVAQPNSNRSIGSIGTGCIGATALSSQPLRELLWI